MKSIAEPLSKLYLIILKKFTGRLKFLKLKNSASFSILTVHNFICLLLPLLLLYPLQGQTLEEEAPEALLQTQLGDQGVDFYIDGKWSTSIEGGIGWMGDGSYRFNQEPDLTISLWLMNSFFLKTSFTDGFDKNTYLMGYKSTYKGLNTEIKAGNTEMSIDGYALSSPGNPVSDSPGLHYEMKNNENQHEFMIRYDPSEEQTRSYYGMNELDEELIKPANYSKGRFFKLPDPEIKTLSVYKQTSDGIYTGSDNYLYTKLETSEFFLNSQNGYLWLTEQAKGKVAVYYTSAGKDVGDSSLGQNALTALNSNGLVSPGSTAIDFSWSETDIYRNWYPENTGLTFSQTSLITINSSDCLLIYEEGYFSPFEQQNAYTLSFDISDTSDQTIRIEMIDQDGNIHDFNSQIIYQTDEDYNAARLYRSEDDSLYNLYPFYGEYSRLYGPGSLSYSQKTPDGMISVRNMTPVDSLTLGSNIVNGSVQMTLNGRNYSNADIDYETGAITIPGGLKSTDILEITYRSNSSSADSQEYLYSQGHRITLNENNIIETSLQASWKPSPEGDALSPASMNLSASWFHKDNTRFDFSATAGLPDSGNSIRLLSMDESALDLGLTETLSGAAPDLDILGYSAAERGKEIYRNYKASSIIWKDYTENSDIDTSVTGPYLAGIPNSSATGLILEYEMESGEKWAAFDILVSSDGPVNASGFNGLDFLAKIIESEGDCKLIIQAGEGGESDELKDDDGWISSPDKNRLITKSGVFNYASNEWQFSSINFSNEEKIKLDKMRTVRFLIDNSSGDPANGRIILNELKLTGSSSFHSGSDDTEYSVTETDEDWAVTDNKLKNVYPDTAGNWLSGENGNSVTSLTWDTLSNGKTLNLKWNLPLITAGQFSETGFYYYPETTGSHTLTATVSDSYGHSVSSEITTDDWTENTWNEARLNIDKGDLKGALSCELTLGGTGSGRILVDEFFAASPILEYTLYSAWKGNYSSSWSLGSGPLTLLGNPGWNTENELLYIVNEEDISWYTDNSFKITMLNFPMTLRASQTGTEDSVQWTLGHNISSAHLPAINASDSFEFKTGEESAYIYKKETLALNPPGPYALSMTHEYSENISIEKTNWTAALNGVELFPSFKMYAEQEQNSFAEERVLSYAEYWEKGLLSFIPDNENLKNRELQGDFKQSVKTGNLTLSVNESLGFKSAPSPDWQIKNIWNHELDMTLLFSEGFFNRWLFNMSYSRDYSATESLRNSSFSEDTSVMTDSYKQNMPYLLFPYAWDLLKPADDFLEENTPEHDIKTDYTPKLELTLGRPGLAHFSDYVLPSDLSLNWERKFIWDDGGSSYEQTMDLTGRATAINLLGKNGVYRLIPFIQSEEITSVLSLEIENSNEWKLNNFVWQEYGEFKIDKQKSLILTSRREQGEDTETQEISINYKWDSPAKNELKVPFIQEPIEKISQLTNNEIIEIKFSESGYQNVFTHESHMNINDIGFFRAWLSFGWNSTKESLFGASAGLELEIQF